MKISPRQLNIHETRILDVVQNLYGKHNTTNEVSIDESNDALIFIKDQTGETVMFANLTNLGDWRANGTIRSDEELVNNWLKR